MSKLEFRIRARNIGAPPISRLNVDLLWHIFNLNTLTDADLINKLRYSPEFSLVTARHTSQVCTDWRSLMLSSSSLWANTINLKHLDQNNDNWRSTILKRTGGSLISVIGDLREGRPATAFFLSLLGNHWTRLRRISICSQDEAISEDERWLSIQTPAPNLEIFHIHFLSHCPTFSTADDALFSNDAPSIHTLIAYNIDFKLSGQRLSRVRHLNLNECSVSQTILFVLADMVALESLELSNINSIDMGAQDCLWPTIILPKLKRIALSVDLRALIVLIGHIAPTSGCISEYESINDTISNPSTADILLLKRGFSAHFQSFFNSGRTEVISWTMMKNLFQLNNVLKEEGNYEIEFFLHIEIDIDSEWHGLPNIILDSLHSCDLSSIKTLELDISDPAMDPPNLYLATFYLSLPSVETLHADSQVIELLVRAQRHPDGLIFFPRLHTVVFDTDAELKSEVIMRYIIRRRDAGKPITYFNLYNCTSPNQDRLLSLEGVDGLNVQWNPQIRDEM